LTSEDYAKERGSLGEDIHEGKRTLMVLNAYEPKNTNVTREEKDRLVEILDMGTNDDDLIMEAIGILRKSGSIDYGFAKSKQMLNDAWTGLAPHLPDGKTKDQLRQPSEYLVNRDL
jgi:geranylgeranyl pyrophosphate synthase